MTRMDNSPLMYQRPSGYSKPLIIWVIVSCWALAACSGPGYYFQAASGQLKLNQAKQSVSDLTGDPLTEPELVKQLETATEILAFATAHLDLPANGSYSSYVDLKREAVTWNVVATPALSLKPKKWCFFIAGCFPYRGFFKQTSATRSAQKYADKGWDVYISPATAYSTLGKFKDPLLSTMFKGSDVRLAAYLFHELAHQRVYTRHDGRFNENYASFVETVGVTAWLEKDDRLDALAQWLLMQQIEKDFSELIGSYRIQLSTLYLGDQSESEKLQQKSAIFRSMKDDYQMMVKQKWDGIDYYSGWFEKPVNNARLALFDTYSGGQCAFANLHERAKGNMIEFNRLAEEYSKLPTEELTQWLNQTCMIVAPTADL